MGRKGRLPKEDRVTAIVEFQAIKNKQQLQPFSGCTNWVRFYLSHVYPALVKMIRKYPKADVRFPEEGLGGGDTEDDKVIQAIKMCVCYYIHIAVLDKASAMDGTCPLELLADSCGIAWGRNAAVNFGRLPVTKWQLPDLVRQHVDNQG